MLRVRAKDGKLVIESIGEFPIFEFEKGKSLGALALSSTEFYVGDYLRVAFHRVPAGKVFGAVLNRGRWG